jgi:hypothetical protein
VVDASSSFSSKRIVADVFRTPVKNHPRAVAFPIVTVSNVTPGPDAAAVAAMPMAIVVRR